MNARSGPKPFWIRRKAELRLAARITAAGLVSFALADLFNLPQGYWAVFTAVLVVQASVGGSLKAAIDRFTGTLGGAIYGAVIATLVPHQDPLMLGIALTLSLAPLAVLASLSTAFRVAPITAVILLLGSAGATEGPVLAAALRTAEVSLGGIVGIAVSLLVVPARAHALVGHIAESVTDQMAALLTNLFGQIAGTAERQRLSSRHDSMQAGFDKLEAAAAEARQERRTFLGGYADTDPIPRTLRRIYHDLVMIGRIAELPPAQKKGPSLAEPLTAFASAAAALLRGTGHALAARIPPPADAEFTSALASALAAIAALPVDERPVALGFALEQMQRNFADLRLRANEFAAGPPQGRVR